MGFPPAGPGSRRVEVTALWLPGRRRSTDRGLLREAAEDAVGPITRLCPHCAATGHGRPRAADGVPLSLAYADGVVLIARSPLPVGVDVEAGDARLREWTRVEAILKAHGTGLRRDPEDVGPDAAEGVVTAAVPLPEGWVGTVAVADSGATALEVVLRNVPAAASRTTTDAADR